MTQTVAYNYARKFIEATDHPDWVGTNNKKAKEKADMIRLCIHQGTKYILPQEGDVGLQINNTTHLAQYANLIRLPYPMVVLEAPLTHYITNEYDEQIVPTIISLLKHSDWDLGFNLVPVQYHGNVRHMPEHKTGWSMAKYAAILTEMDIKQWNGNTLDSLGFNIASMDEDSPATSLNDPAFEEDNAKFKDFYGRLMRIALEFIIYANTRNIGVETIYAPAALNKARKKKGYQANYDYKILNIHQKMIQSGGKSANETVGRHKNRFHMVSGHPRWLKGHDKPIWINAHSRGDAALGIVDKAYKI